MSTTRDYTWYIHVNDIHTNGVIAQAFSANENCAFGIMCADDVPRNLWRTDHALLTYLKESKKKHEVLDFAIFLKEGRGRPRLWEGFPKDRFAQELQALTARVKTMKAHATGAVV